MSAFHPKATVKADIRRFAKHKPSRAKTKFVLYAAQSGHCYPDNGIVAARDARLARLGYSPRAQKLKMLVGRGKADKR